MNETMPHKGYHHRVPDLVDEFDDDDLAAFAQAAERAADDPNMDEEDLSELYGAADTAREAATIKRRKQKQG